MHWNSHKGFRLLPKIMTLNDLERRNSRYFTKFGAHYVTMAEVPIFLRKNVVQIIYLLSMYHLWWYSSQRLLTNSALKWAKIRYVQQSTAGHLSNSWSFVDSRKHMNYAIFTIWHVYWDTVLQPINAIRTIHKIDPFRTPTSVHISKYFNLFWPTLVYNNLQCI